MCTVGPRPFRGYISDRIHSGQLRVKVVVMAEACKQTSHFSVGANPGKSVVEEELEVDL
jgi:hypothetical protein